jgi:hypothetical protein
MAKKKVGRKPRIPQLGLDFGQSRSISGMQRNSDGSYTLFGDDGKPLVVPSAYAALGFDRPKGPKVTVQVPDSGDTVGSIRRAIDKFDRIVGADTSYHDHEGKRICATAVVELSKLQYNDDRWTAEANPLWAFEFHDPIYDPERIGWLHALKTGEQHYGWLNAGASLLLVVDAHLDDLHQINQRKLPILDNEFLPAGVSLAYASADTTGSALNGLIARCDRIAKEVLTNAINPSPRAMAGPLLRESRIFAQYRYWHLALPAAAK